jgi:hypothetical protein
VPSPGDDRSPPWDRMTWWQRAVLVMVLSACFGLPVFLVSDGHNLRQVTGIFLIIGGLNVAAMYFQGIKATRARFGNERAAQIHRRQSRMTTPATLMVLIGILLLVLPQ